jgi:hypothetical protein
MIRLKINDLFMLAIIWISVRRKEPKCGSNTWQRLYFVSVCIAASAFAEIKFLNVFIHSNCALLVFLNVVMCNTASEG